MMTDLMSHVKVVKLGMWGREALPVIDCVVIVKDSLPAASGTLFDPSTVCLYCAP